MASVEQYVEKNGTRTWTVRARKPDGTPYKKRGFATKREAVAHAQDFESAKRRGTWLDGARGGVSFDHWAQRYLERRIGKVAPGTLENLRTRVNEHLVPVFGPMPLSLVGPSDVEDWQAALSRRLAPATVNSTLGTLRQIFRFAIRERAISINPCQGVDALPVDTRRGREIHPLVRGQVVALAKELAGYEFRGRVDSRYALTAPLVALGTGLRPEELWALRVQHFDFDRRILRVTEAVTEEKGGLLTKPPKNGKPRTISLDETTVALVEEHLRKHGAPDGLVFTTPNGKQVLHHNFLSRVFGPAVKRLGDTLPPDFRFYDLRHTHATLLIDEGWRPDQVRDRLGHGSIRTTYDWYGHLFPGHDAELVGRLGDLNREALSDAS